MSRMAVIQSRYLDYDLNVYDEPGDNCCVQVELTKEGKIVRTTKINKIHLAGIVAEWKNGVDAIIRLEGQLT